MYIDKVIVTDTVHLGDNNYKKIECSVNLVQGESANEAEIMASSFIEDSLRRKYPYLFKDKGYKNVPDIDVNKFIAGMQKAEMPYFDIPTEERPGTNIDTASPEFIKMQIQTCKSIPVLKIYKKNTIGNIELETIYNQKLDELSK